MSAGNGYGAWFLSACLALAGCGTATGGAPGKDATGQGAADAAVADADAEVATDADVEVATDADVDAATETGPGTDVWSLPSCATAADCPLNPPCKAWACQKSVCVPQDKPDGGACDDGDLCTQGEGCSAGLCQGGQAKSCDDLNPCTTDSCVAAGGCVHLATAASSACDDGDGCTLGDACQAGQCVPGLNTCQCQTHADCGKVEDGNACNGTLYCDWTALPHVCKLNPASAVTCPTGQDGPCAKNACNPTTGACKLLAVPGGTPCDDGEACTQGDACLDGLCTPGTYVCACGQDADCGVLEDGDKCNGTLYCNKANSKCELNPQTVVTCQTVEDTVCAKNLCNPKEGKCHVMPVGEGNVCDDGNLCTANESCSDGQCTATANTCECQKDADCGSKEDGNLCNGTLYCDNKTNTCKVNPATAVHCGTAGDTDCLRNVCDPASGKCQASGTPMAGKACDDGNPCTPLATCAAGQCTSTNNLCACQKDADCGAKEDGDLCNGTLYCDLQIFKCVVNPATVVACAGAFDEACLTNQCNAKTGTCGMKPAFQGNQCAGGACSGGGWCDVGACAASVQMACECTADTDCAALDDGDACNGKLYCDKTGAKPVCKVSPATVVKCKTVDDTACVHSLCQPKTGQCAPVAVAGSCDDGQACTGQDTCTAGLCQGLALQCDDNVLCTVDTCVEPFGCVNLSAGASQCDDGNPCTQDGCDAKNGCTATPNAKACDDNNACTTKDVCSQGVCAGFAAGCDDQNVCTLDGCDTAGGCTHKPAVHPCDDGNACTLADACTAGACKPGSAKACDDGNPCTADTCLPLSGDCTSVFAAAQLCNDKNPCTDEVCHPVLGCGHPTNWAACDDGDPCTAEDQCSSGKCVGFQVKLCDDGKVCTVDSCDAKLGCVHAFNAAQCDDGVQCTVQDTCSSGQCKGLLDCGDGNSCTLDACDYVSAKCTHTLLSGPCDDGDKCTLGETCKGAVCLPASVSVCDDGNVCTDDSCDSQKGCVTAPNTQPCNAKTCTFGDTCKAGSCVSTGVPRLYETVWSSGPSSVEVAWAVTPTTDGGHLVGGMAKAPCDQCFAIFVKRLDAKGQAVWTTKLDFGWSTLDGLAMAPYPDGSCLVTRGSGGWVSVTKLDPAGKEAWTEKKFFGTQPFSLLMTPGTGPTAGTVFGCGYIYLGWPVHGSLLHAFEAKTGATLWTSYVSENQESRCKGVAPQDDGSVIWAGFTGSTVPLASPVGKPAPKPLGKNDLLLVHVTADGKYEQQWRYGGAEDDIGMAIVNVPGGYVMVGTTASVGAGLSDVWLLRVAADGSVVWQTTLGGSGIDEGRDLAVLSDGTLLVLGNTTIQGVQVPLLAQLRADGVVMWQRTIDPGPGGGDLKHIALQADGGTALVGTRKTLDFPAGAMWLVRADAWGQSSCSKTGVCAELSPITCDEGNPCTREWSCDSVLGCDHTPSVEACDDGDPCSKSSACVNTLCKASAPTICDDANPCTTETCDSNVKGGCVFKVLKDGVACGAGQICQAGKCQ